MTTTKSLPVSDAQGTLSPSGVWIADDFRSNLIIDRYDPVFANMQASKLKHLRSANSEDAMTWNIFRSLRQIAPTVWLPALWSTAFPSLLCPEDHRVSIHLWKNVPPPLGLLDDGDEGISEIDVVIESPTWVWFIEAKLKSDISIGTATRPDRDQILRTIDVGSYYAGIRDFYCSLLIMAGKCSPVGAQRIREYSDLPRVTAKLAAHRKDGLRNLRSVGQLAWSQVGAVLTLSAEQSQREDERSYAIRASDWLQQRML